MISIIMRSLGQRPLLMRRAVESIVPPAQDDVELILVWDGVPRQDQVLEWCRPKVVPVHVELPASQGRAGAGNAGAAVARGRYLTFLDDDDYLLPGHLADLAQLLDGHPRAGLAHAPAYLDMVDRAGRVRSRRLHGTGRFNPALLLLENCFAIQAVLFRRELWSQAGGFDPCFPVLEDWDLWLRLAGLAEFIGIDRPSSVFHLPWEAETRRARAQEHMAVRPAVLDKHAQTSFPVSLAQMDEVKAHWRDHLDDWVSARQCLARLWRRVRNGE